MDKGIHTSSTLPPPPPMLCVPVCMVALTFGSWAPAVHLHKIKCSHHPKYKPTYVPRPCHCSGANHSASYFSSHQNLLPLRASRYPFPIRPLATGVRTLIFMPNHIVSPPPIAISSSASLSFLADAGLTVWKTIVPGVKRTFIIKLKGL